MKAYYTVRDWVDRQWRASGSQFRILFLPAIVPLIAVSTIGNGLISNAVGWAWFGAWNVFVALRYWVYIREASRKADEEFDRVGKFQLASEYHDTESGTSAAKRKRNS
ncbi:hypothetical protein SH591_01595 [Sphingomonas sp. LY54]|uniref:hypothetical protein n=1 Tax=Sphingomonas sp. LY54 TaxID=3095343 RepID=UPI002D78E1D2|nr:hypothetical protein [Sphingomonas sp. LY54]WRP28903.1 hypothetical protein SH591_01595 [Sphingomonas sp. LY54]